MTSRDLRVEFWIDPAANLTGDSGVWLYMSTDQVRFYDSSQSDPLPLQEVPAIVVTEIMRDVDLFVGVASIGADPNWQDSGETRFHTYWETASFGDLSRSAQTRHTVLETLIPRLKIADQCELSDRFLIVRGKIRIYKIHLGSSNIQMEPNDQYLCIVPDRRARRDEIALPFDGDRTLSVILSKAFLLADDDKIKDKTILSQIR